MKKILIILVVILFAEANITAQLSLEAIVGGGINMTLLDDATQYKNNNNSHFLGYNIETGFGARLFLLDKSWSLGLGLSYQFKYHIWGVRPVVAQIPDYEIPYHCFLMPLDLNYNLKNGIGFHLGLEFMMEFLRPEDRGFVHYQQNFIPNLLAGVSYSFGRFRLQLQYKHSLAYYERVDLPIFSRGQAGYETESLYFRYHDIELRLAVRLYEWKNL